MAPRLNIVVIGGGIIGAATAVELLRDGHAVTVLDPGPPGGTQAASYGNGAWLSPSSVVPVSMPGLWKKIPGYLMDPLGPLAIRWRYLPRLLPWLVRFVLAGRSVARVEATARALRPLVRDAPARHLALAREAGVAELIERHGLLYVFPDRAAFEAEALAWRLRRDNGVRWIELDADELRQREPELDRRYGFAVMVEDGANCADPGAYVAALMRHAEALGARVLRASATGFDIQAGRLRAVLLAEGAALPCDRAVLCAGVRSRDLAARLGDRVPLEAERGYHVTIADPEAAPRHPIMPSDGKMATTRLRGGLRVAGQVELAALDAPADWRRAEVLLKYALRSFPGLSNPMPEARVARWMGNRPSLPDGLPVIGPASLSADVIHAFGHGHIGLASGPVTGRLVADLVAGRPPVIDPAPYSVRRFA